jgi:cytidylate kinase
MAIITISRLTGSGGRDIATAISEGMGFRLIDRNAMDALVDEQFPVRAEELAKIRQDGRIYHEMLRSAIAELSRRQNVVIVGGGAQFLFARVAASLHVQIIAPFTFRTARVMKLAGLDRSAAESLIEEKDREKAAFISGAYGEDWRDPVHYDMVLNVDHFSTETAVKIIIMAARAKGIETQPVELPAQLRAEILTTKLDVAERAATAADLEPDSSLPEFAHPSEREFARVMDFYRIRWEYEPRTFPIEWDTDKNVTGAFTPDFYLPDLDLFIELTTMKQSLVTRKNRKVRQLREHYPDINIKILYERDYRNLIWKYGLNGDAGNNGETNGDEVEKGPR